MTRIVPVWLAALVACGGGKKAPPPDPNSIGAAGGVVSAAGGPSVTIPPGALPAQTTITIEETALATPDGALTSVYRFGPDGTVFAKPVTVAFPVATGISAASVYWSRPGSPTVYDALDAEVTAGKATASVTHFSLGFAGAACRSGSDCAEAATCRTASIACTSGTPVCNDTGPAPDLFACGIGKVCISGACVEKATRTVSGTIRTVYETDDGQKTTVAGAPAENPFIFNAILIPSGEGYNTVPVSVQPDSTFSIHNVPEGRYFLQLDYPVAATDAQNQPITVYDRTLAEVTTSTPDLTTLIAGRADRAHATQATPISMSLTNLAGWVSGNYIQIVTSNASAYATYTPSPAPAAGAMTLSATFNWPVSSIITFAGLPNAAKGDVTYVFQKSNVSGGVPSAVRTGIGSYAALNLTVPDGGGTLNAGMQTPGHASVPANLKLSQFAAMAHAVNPAAVPDLVTWDMRALPHSAVYGERVYDNFSLRLGRLIPDDVATDADFGSLDYARFLPSFWQENLLAQYDYRVDLADPLDGSKVFQDFSPQVIASFPAGNVPASWAPTVDPPASPTISGADAFTPRSGVGTHPVIAWSAPARGTITSYELGILQTTPATAGAIVYLLVRLHSTTPFTVPAGFLQAGAAYAGTLNAWARPGEAIDGPVFASSGIYAAASCDFGQFRP